METRVRSALSETKGADDKKTSSINNSQQQKMLVSAGVMSNLAPSVNLNSPQASQSKQKASFARIRKQSSESEDAGNIGRRSVASSSVDEEMNKRKKIDE